MNVTRRVAAIGLPGLALLVTGCLPGFKAAGTEAPGDAAPGTSADGAASSLTTTSDGAPSGDGGAVGDCRPTELVCDGGCVSRDTSNCASCGNACPADLPVCGPTTDGGYACRADCSAAETLCGTTCTVTANDPANCGGCGPAHACAAAQTCEGGACVCLPCVLDLSTYDQCCVQ